MNQLPFYLEPYPDEMFYSWAHRLAGAHGLSYAAFMAGYADGMDKAGPDGLRGLAGLYGRLPGGRDMPGLFLSLTTFGFESIAMTPGRQARHINSATRKNTPLNSPVNSLVRPVRVCPECMREDAEKYGEPYLRRAQNLSGVSCCPEHGVPLLVYGGKPGNECDYDGNYAEAGPIPSESDARAYAKYAHALLKADISSDAYKVKDAIFSRMAELGYGTSDGYDSFLEDFEDWRYSGLWNGGDIVHFLKVKLISAQHLTMEEVIPLLMFLYPDADNAAVALDRGEPLLAQYTCPDCGRIYCATPSSAADGWGCPYCDADIPERDRFRALVAITGRGEYEPLDEFESMDRKVRFLHKPCGKTVEIKPRGFLFEGVRCLCEYTVSEEEARQAVEANPGFKLIEFTRTDGPVTIYHETCGRQFKCTYRKFIEFPGCRACNPPNMTAELFRERVHDLTGGEYEAVSDFVDQQTPVEILHTFCGKTQSYLPRHFISDQQRCHACGKMPAWEESFSLLEQYKSEYGSVNISKRDSYRGYSLGRWCQGQRDNYKKGALTAEQIRRLEGIGFAWDPLEAEWRDNCERYKRYAEQNGTTKIPRRRDFEGVHLGAWVDTQKKRYAEGKLSAERREKLLLINPDLFNERS